MRWLRPTIPRDDAGEALEVIEARLHAAAAEAPPSHRAEEIRTALLEQVAAGRSPAPGLAPLALAAGALLLALAVGVAAPAVGSFIGTLLDRGSGPSDELPPGPAVTDRSGLDDIPMPTDVPIPARELAASPSAVPSNAAADPAQPADPAGTNAAQPAAPAPAPATPTPTPSPSPAGPPGPPMPVSTPPVTPPPTGTPGG